jgi:hypothetical protein
VPATKKGMYNFHVAQVQGFFKGYHVHIHARNDMDIEPNAILQKVKDSSGAKYSAQQAISPPKVSFILVLI